MFFTILLSYAYGILIEKIDNKRVRKILFILTLSINIGLLCFFKYIDFIIINLNNLSKTKFDLFNIALPLGISFYTFQNISYICDVYTKKEKAQRNIINLATYIFLFPQLIAGPIVRYNDIKNQLENRTHTFEKFSDGARRFIIGLSKKVLIANILGELATTLMNNYEITVLGCWGYAISFTLQIYFDFSGYSDMAIGLGKIFGFEFLENFNYPYISKSITEFWRRWHMSLSSWFKDYVYIPLGGNRNGIIKQIKNILIVWVLTGIWHGAGWNFIIWGIYFGIILIFEKLFLLRILEKIPVIFRRIYTLIIVLIGFVIFNSNNTNEIINILNYMFIPLNKNIVNDYTMYYLKSNLILIAISIFASTPILKNIILKLKEKNKYEKTINILEIIILPILLIICTSYLIDNSFNPFLYFRF